MDGTFGSHSPQGECGLKLTADDLTSTPFGHSPQGECGLKPSATQGNIRNAVGHSPQGECGLKLDISNLLRENCKVTPRKGSVD